jgi:hypothetical protein
MLVFVSDALFYLYMRHFFIFTGLVGSFFYFVLMPVLLYVFRKTVMSFRAPNLKVINTSRKVIFLRIFNNGFVDASAIVAVSPGEELSLPIPPASSIWSVPLIAWTEKRKRLEEPEKREFQWRPIPQLGTGAAHLQYNKWTRHFGSVRVFSTVELMLMNRIEELIKSSSQPILQKEGGGGGQEGPAEEEGQEEEEEGQQPTVPVHVELLKKDEICRAEREWLPLRRQHTQAALKKLLKGGKCRKDCGNVALFSSGGGLNKLYILANKFWLITFFI